MQTQLTGIRKDIFIDRYALRNSKGEVVEQNPSEMWERVALGISSIEKTKKLQKEWKDKFYDLLSDFKFVPGGRILLGAGTKTTVTFYNCFVIPSPADSRKGIIETLSIMTEIMARGGGVGFNISTLRPCGSYVATVNGTSSGPVNWAEIYSVMTHDVIQQGGTRRGALMLMMWDWHPDIEEFITVKRDMRRMAGANLSVCVSDRFMEAVKRNEKWELVFPATSDPRYKTDWDGDIEKWKRAKLPVRVYKTIKARDLWSLIYESAWVSAEPGLVFMDRANKFSNTWYFEKLVSTNPCGEQPLPPWGVCDLGAINLTAFVHNGEFDYRGLSGTVRAAVRFLDNVTDAEHYIFPQMEEKQMSERRIGLGTMGLADTLILMRVRYGGKTSIEIIEKIYRTIRDAAYETSSDLAIEKGSFPRFDKTKYLKGEFVGMLPAFLVKKIAKQGIRNSVILTQAPTGKTSLLAGVSSGIEPVFAFSYKQKDRLGERMMHHPLYQVWLDEHKEAEKAPDYFVTANDLTPEDHVLVQAAIQKYTDSSISKTVNAPKTHTVEDVKKLYLLAYETGCKGITYMREGSREGTLIRSEEENAKKKHEAGLSINEVKPRPMKLAGATYRMDTPVGMAYITVNHNGGGEPMEIFVNVGKAGSDIASLAEAIGRLISLVLRVASPLTTWERAETVVNELRGIGGSKSLGFGDNKVRSLPDAIAKAISAHFGFKNGNGAIKRQEMVSSSEPKLSTEHLSIDANDSSSDLFDICPKCGVASFAYEEGCKKCYSCGYSEC